MSRLMCRAMLIMLLTRARRLLLEKFEGRRCTSLHGATYLRDRRCVVDVCCNAYVIVRV